MIEHELAGTRLRAISIGGIETSIDLPELRVAFDIGRCPPEVVARDTVLFTHAHMDHMGGIAYHAATRALRNLAPPTYVVPHENARDLEDLFSVWRRLDGSTRYTRWEIERLLEKKLPAELAGRVTALYPPASSMPR